MPRAGFEVQVENLQALRRTLRATDTGSLRAVQATTKQAAEIVAGEARRLAPRRTGRLAMSIRASTSGASGVVRSPLPYAAVVHWGGTIRPRGVPIHFPRTEFIYHAFERKEEEVARHLASEFDRIARDAGF